MKHKIILFVCSGNTCRSPMAEAALRSELKKRKIPWIAVRSAGTGAEAGNAMSPLAAEALKNAAIPVSPKFRSRKLTEKMIKEAHVVICMTEAQKNMISSAENVVSFAQLCGRDIPDPYGQDLGVYTATLGVLFACAPLIIERYILKQGDIL